MHFWGAASVSTSRGTRTLAITSRMAAFAAFSFSSSFCKNIAAVCSLCLNAVLLTRAHISCPVLVVWALGSASPASATAGPCPSPPSVGQGGVC
jgi:hypothetical protein